MVNLFAYEHHIRLSAGLLALLYAVMAKQWWLLPIALYMIYTGALRYCPVFHLLGINKTAARRKYHLALLPMHNPEPVYLFNMHGELIFRNHAAKNILPGLESLEGLNRVNDFTEFTVNDNSNEELMSFHEGGKTYFLRLQTIGDTSQVAAFGFDVTRLLEAQQEIISTQKELIIRLGEIGETRSRETGNHVKRVAEYSRLLAKLSGLGAKEAGLLKMASPMHDIGKVAIPDRILLKSGKLDEEEWEIMKTHASIGYELLRHSERPILQAAAIVAGQHHEKWDGSGYPNAYSGEDIHIYGRITALADVFDALGSERVYKKAWPLERILALLDQQKGLHFDPRLVDLLIANLDSFLQIRDQFSDVTQPPDDESKEIH